MSYKYSARQAGPNRYVLPRSGEMRCEVTAFLSPDLYQKTEEELWADAARCAGVPGAKRVVLMPDTHRGGMLPVGGVLVTEDTILQAGSGYDISCGVVHMRVPGLHARDVADYDKRMRWVGEVSQHVSLGYKAPRALRQVKPSLVPEVLRHGARALGVRSDLCERHSIPVPDDFDEKLIDAAHSRAAGQLGSVGGGNHFVEMQCDRDSGEVWLMVHCGSRGFGWHAADYFFRRGAALRGLPVNRREESWLRVGEDLGKLYWGWHSAAANYAVANRHLIADIVAGVTEDLFGARAELYYEISHNLVQRERLLLPDGTVEEGFVHRKGATRAFPAGHPDLDGTPWQQTGHPCLIPGSMLAGAAILFPRPGAAASACSVNHGSGRLIRRNDAKRDLAPLQQDIDAEMRDVLRVMGGAEVRGIATNNEKTPLDECDAVYKDLDSVLDVLVAEGIAELRHRLWPVANLKGME